MNQLTNLKSLILIPLALACFSLAPKVFAFGIPLSCNTSDGFEALFNLTTGTSDTAVGGQALFLNRIGSENTAVGCSALFHNVNGDANIATGFEALFSNTGGASNTAIGDQALFSNTIANNNTATGAKALFTNTTGGDNTATGVNALFSNTNGSFNTAVGGVALQSNTTGQQNTAIGDNALGDNTTGNSNIAIGVAAGSNITTGSNNIDIGNIAGGGINESGTIRIGTQFGDLTQTATYIAGISGTTVVGSAVFVTSAGQLGVAASSARFKDEIKPMDKTSEAILALKPVTFRYKKELDPKGIPQFGLVAEEVEKVNPDLITRDRDGKPYTVRYEVVNAMLLNEFLKEHRTVQDQQKEIDALKAQLKEQRTLIQKISDKMELTKPTPQVARNDQ
jgi:hypothetical protein